MGGNAKRRRLRRREEQRRELASFRPSDADDSLEFVAREDGSLTYECHCPQCDYVRGFDAPPSIWPVMVRHSVLCELPPGEPDALVPLMQFSEALCDSCDPDLRDHWGEAIVEHLDRLRNAEG